MLNLLND